MLAKNISLILYESQKHLGNVQCFYWYQDNIHVNICQPGNSHLGQQPQKKMQLHITYEPPNLLYTIGS